MKLSTTLASLVLLAITSTSYADDCGEADKAADENEWESTGAYLYQTCTSVKGVSVTARSETFLSSPRYVVALAATDSGVRPCIANRVWIKDELKPTTSTEPPKADSSEFRKDLAERKALFNTAYMALITGKKVKVVIHADQNENNQTVRRDDYLCQLVSIELTDVDAYEESTTKK